MAEAALREQAQRKEIKRRRPRAGYSDTLVEAVRVLIKVPKINKHGTFVEGHSFRNKKGKKVVVKPHYESRAVINGEKFQRNIYNWLQHLAGRKVVADVEVRRKVTSQKGEVIGLIDIYLRPELPAWTAPFVMRFSQEEGTKISGLKTRVNFAFKH